jgi:LuxR family maltose regulon positive regulatory protein
MVVENLAVAQLVPRYGAGRLRPLFRALPPTATSRAATLVRAALALSSHRYNTCTQLLESAGPRGGTAAPPSSAETLTMAVLSAVSAAASDAPVERVLAAVARARTLLDADDRTVAHTELRALVEDAAADALFREGQFAEAAEASRVAMAAADGQLAAEQVNCMGRLAFIAAWSGRCRRAIRLAERANGLRAAARLPASCAPLSEIALAWAYTETGERSRAMRHASAAKGAAAETHSASGAGLTRVAEAIVQARIRRAHGDLRGAHAALAEGGRSGAGAPTWARDQVVVEQAVVHLLEGEPRGALDLPNSLSGSVREAASIVRTEAELLCVGREVPAVARMTTPGDDLSIRVQKSLLDALFQARRGNERAFVEALERALRMAAPEHLRRPFSEAPEPIRRALSTRRDLIARHPWLADAESARPRTRLAPGGRGAGGDAGSLIEPLTGKELEVLGLLAQLLTTEETAAAMFVSVNTVRTHVRNILRKMGVARRHQAIRRDWDLGILPST